MIDYIAGFFVGIAVAFAVITWKEFDRYESGKTTKGYAAALAACANGQSFTIGKRVVHCVVTDVQ